MSKMSELTFVVFMTNALPKALYIATHKVYSLKKYPAEPLS
jgi:hypothetical protein